MQFLLILLFPERHKKGGHFWPPFLTNYLICNIMHYLPIALTGFSYHRDMKER